MYNIHLLPASFGDAILIEYGNCSDSASYILIDGGPYFVFEDVMKGIKKVAPAIKELELLVVTHIDIDHIDGIIKLLNQSKAPFVINEIWFNGWDQIVPHLAPDDILGGKQGEYLSALIKMKGLSHNTSFGDKEVVLSDDQSSNLITLAGGMEIVLLNPTKEALGDLGPDWADVVDGVGDEDAALERLKEDFRYDDEPSDLLGDLNIEDLMDSWVKGDKSTANGSSIAFIASYNGKSCLFAGDAHSDKLVDALKSQMIEGEERLAIDVWKLAHHGSKKSTLESLMKMISCKNILVSSDGKRYKHPDEETLAKLIKHNGPNLNFHFNYHTTFTSMWDDPHLKAQYKYMTWYPETGSAGITYKLT